MEALADSRYGLTRDEIANVTKISSNGNLSQMLTDLENSGFIAKRRVEGDRARNIYALVDFYTFFYLKMAKNNYGINENYFSSTIDTPLRHNYFGLTFELVCFYHLEQIKHKLGISGIVSSCYTFITKGDENTSGSQIDLVIDRKDKVISVIEIKYTESAFGIDKDYNEKIRNKISSIRDYKKGKNSLQFVMISASGLKDGKYNNIVNKIITLDDLFIDRDV